MANQFVVVSRKGYKDPLAVHTWKEVPDNHRQIEAFKQFIAGTEDTERKLVFRVVDKAPGYPRTTVHQSMWWFFQEVHFNYNNGRFNRPITK